MKKDQTILIVSAIAAIGVAIYFFFIRKPVAPKPAAGDPTYKPVSSAQAARPKNPGGGSGGGIDWNNIAGAGKGVLDLINGFLGNKGNKGGGGKSPQSSLAGGGNRIGSGSNFGGGSGSGSEISTIRGGDLRELFGETPEDFFANENFTDPNDEFGRGGEYINTYDYDQSGFGDYFPTDAFDYGFGDFGDYGDYGDFGVGDFDASYDYEYDSGD